MRPLPGEDIWRSVDLLRDLVNDIHRRVRSLEERQPPQRTEVARPGDDFHVGTVVCRVDNPSVVGEVIGFVELSGGLNLRVNVLNEDTKWRQMYWPAGSCRFAAPSDLQRAIGGPGPAPAPPSLTQLALDEASEAQKRFVFHAEAAGPPPTSILAASPLAPPEVENLCADAHAREEVLVALVRRAANEIRDGQARRDLLADLEALLAEDS